MYKASSLWHTSSINSEFRIEDILPTKNELLLHSKYSFISQGTERLVATGQIPSDLNQYMKVPYMKGDFDLPISYGYSLVAEDKNTGNLYHVMHPHQNIIQINRKHATLIPDSIPGKRAVLISNMETAWNAWIDGHVILHENVLVIGFGNIGALVACLLKIKGFDNISVMESNSYRRTKAKELGFKLVEEKSNEAFELAYHTTGTSVGLQFAIDNLTKEGRIVELSWYGNKMIQLALGKKFHYNRISIISSQVSSIPKSVSDIYNFNTRKQEVLKILQFDIWDQLLDREILFQDAPSMFEKIRKNEINELGLVINYNSV